MTQHSDVSQTFKKFSFSKFGNIEVITIYVTRFFTIGLVSIRGQRGDNFTIILGSKINFVETALEREASHWDSTIQFAFNFAVL